MPLREEVRELSDGSRDLESFAREPSGGGGRAEEAGPGTLSFYRNTLLSPIEASA
jgi:hypothetical protein